MSFKEVCEKKFKKQYNLVKKFQIIEKSIEIFIVIRFYLVFYY